MTLEFENGNEVETKPSTPDDYPRNIRHLDWVTEKWKEEHPLSCLLVSARAIGLTDPPRLVCVRKDALHLLAKHR